MSFNSKSPAAIIIIVQEQQILSKLDSGFHPESENSSKPDDVIKKASKTD